MFAEIISCPEILPDSSTCAMPAEVMARFVLESTLGPTEHLATNCLNGHRLLFQTAYLEQPAA